MAWLVALQIYLSWNLFFVIFNIVMILLMGLERMFMGKITATVQLRGHYLSLNIFTLMWGGLLLWPATKFTPTLLQVLRSPDQKIVLALKSAPGLWSSRVAESHASAEYLNFTFQSLFISLGLGAAAFLLCALYRLQRSLQHAQILRTVAGVKIYRGNGITEPFSLWQFNCLGVYVPDYILEDRPALRVVLTHELQHHRQGDTRMVYLFYLLKILFFWNPFFHLYAKKIFELQEFACDEVLVDRKHVSPRAYAGYLLGVAERASASLPVCTTGFFKERSLLKRRIEKMLIKKKSSQTRTTIATSTVTIALSLGFFVAAWGAKGIVQDRQLTRAQAEQLAQAAQSPDFPLPINGAVLAALNYDVGTAAGRDHMRKSLDRMEGYRALIEKTLGDYGLPAELMAIPIVESGYQNLAPRKKKPRGAGLWMFIADTAKNYGLRVDEIVDQRMDEEILTDAAMRLLQANKLRFKHWHLSLLAYNGGERHVQELHDKTNSWDPWTLADAGAESDQGYLARVISAAIILKNPQLLD